MIKDATLTSVCKNGYSMVTKCKVDMKTKEVFDIEFLINKQNLISELAYEYVTVDGMSYFVSCDEEVKVE